MKVVQVGGVFLLASGLAIRNEFHLDIPAYHGEPQPANPFNVVSTATATAMFPQVNGYLSRIPL